MTLKPSRARAFGKTFLFSFIAALVMMAVIRFSEGKGLDPWGMLSLGILAGSVLGLCTAIGQTPGEISWNDESISIRSIIPGSGEYRWDELVSYRPQAFHGFGLFVLKFRGTMAYQISALGFDKEGWGQLQEFLGKNHPAKRK